jgi:ferredoxin
MGVFIKVNIDRDKCLGIAACGKCVQQCPVNIFENQPDIPGIAADNEDECTLCDICLNACEPTAISIVKLYE